MENLVILSWLNFLALQQNLKYLYFFHQVMLCGENISSYLEGDALFLLQYRNQRGEHMFTATDKSFKGLSAACSLKWRLSKKACVTEHGKDFRISSEIYILLLNSASVWLLSNTNQVIWVSLNTYTNISASFFPKSDNSMNK